MHIDEIIAALAANDLGTIKEAFLSLAVLNPGTPYAALAYKELEAAAHVAI
jgi:putative ABC transport system substrate-binding protein